MMGVNLDFVKERNKFIFDVEELLNFIYRGLEKVKRRRYLCELLIYIFFNE